MKKAGAAVLLASVTLGCAGSPRLPKELSFEGARLEKATSWSRGSISGVAFVPPGEKLETASLQVGIILSREHASGAQLHTWVMDQYRHSPTAQWHESVTSDEACKVGLPAGPPRPFVTLHVCRGGPHASACAEADERLSDEIVSMCLNRGWDCWDELCTQKWNSRRSTLEALAKSVVEEH